MDDDMKMMAVADLTKNGKEFHISELTKKLSDITGEEIKPDAARYIANQLVMKKILDRREINPRLFVYSKRRGANLSASLTVNAHTSPES